MSDSREFALLADLARLLKKHGPKAFEDLASRLGDPEFVDNLEALLRGTSEAGKKRKTSNAKSKSRRGASFLKALDELEENEPQKVVLLRGLYEGIVSKELLPTLRDMKDFAFENGFTPLRSKSRQNAIVPFLKQFLELPESEIEAMIQRILATSAAGDRSLEGWSNIILRDKDG